jgi:hypothetical protein
LLRLSEWSVNLCVKRNLELYLYDDGCGDGGDDDDDEG